MTMIPARYTGQFPVRMGREHGPRHNDQQQRVDGTVLRPGDVVLMPDTEVLGQTYWHDPLRLQPSLFLGAGHVVRPEDVSDPETGRARSREELLALGYEFHEGRSDFEPLTPPPSARKGKKTTQAATATATATATPVVMPTVSLEEEEGTTDATVALTVDAEDAAPQQALDAVPEVRQEEN